MNIREGALITILEQPDLEHFPYLEASPRVVISYSANSKQLSQLQITAVMDGLSQFRPARPASMIYARRINVSLKLQTY